MNPILASMMFGGQAGGGGGGGEPFEVELTATSTNLTSGVMDKTVGEITAAWQEGKRILFWLRIAGAGSIAFYCSNATLAHGSSYPSFEAVFAQGFSGSAALSWFFTGATDVAGSNEWRARHFPITDA